MSVRQGFPDPAHTALRLVGLMVVLFGLFGMHGLANHGFGGMENMPQVTAPASLGSTVDLVSVGLTGQDGPLAEPVPGAATLMNGHGHQGMDMTMMGLCVAILAVGLLALLLLLRDGRTPRALWFLQRQAFDLTPAGRDPDPPSLRVLSIQRC